MDFSSSLTEEQKKINDLINTEMLILRVEIKNLMDKFEVSLKRKYLQQSNGDDHNSLNQEVKKIKSQDRSSPTIDLDKDRIDLGYSTKAWIKKKRKDPPLSKNKSQKEEVKVASKDLFFD